MNLDGKCIPPKRENLSKIVAGKYWPYSRNSSKSMRMREEKEVRVVLGDKVCWVQIFLDFEFQIKGPDFIVHSLQSPTDSMVQKDNFFVVWMRRKRTKGYLGIKRDILKVKGTEFDVLVHGKSDGQEENINHPIFSNSSAWKY